MTVDDGRAAALPEVHRGRQTWTRISCGEREAIYAVARDDWQAVATRTDLEGHYGTPIILTQWARPGQPPTLMDVRWPKVGGGPDVAPCEHYIADPNERLEEEAS